MFDPLSPSTPVLDSESVYQCKDAVSVYAKLPGLTYYKFDIPKLPNFIRGAGARDLVTIVAPNDYCCITINSNGYIIALTYMGTRQIPIANLQCLYGTHEKYYNRLISRYDEGVIPDFIS